MAEGILKDKLKHLHFQAVVDSCGFESFHVGDAPDSRAQEVAKERGIDISSHRARLFTMKDFDRFDYIYAMDSSHYNNIIRLARNDADVEKVDYLLNVLSPGQNRGVQDPWYHDMKAFERVYIQLEEACTQITLNLVNQPHK